MDRIWQWTWDRHGPRYTWTICAVVEPTSCSRSAKSGSSTHLGRFACIKSDLGGHNGYYVGVVEQISRVTLTNPDKVLYPATGTTKAEVFDYYVNIAEAMIPHIAGRAVTRKRWPNGVDAPSFPIPDPSGRQRVPRADR